MAFTPKDWKDDPDHTTPITAAALEDLEERLAAYAESVGQIIARLATVAELAAYTRTGNKLEANANGALANIDGVAPAVNDVVLLRNGKAGADNGPYKVTSLGSAGAKWTMERITQFDTSEETRTGTVIFVSEGTICKDRQFALTTNAPITLNTTSLTFSPTAPKDFGIVEALPTTEALTGDLCTYKTAQTGVYWQLIYTGSESYWAVINGPPLFDEVTTAQATSSASFVNLTTEGPKVTCPLAGDYYVRVGADVFGGGTGNKHMSYAIGGTAASEEDSAIFGTAGTTVMPGDRLRKKTGIAAATALVAKYKSTSGEASFQHRWMEVQPIRVK